MKFNEILKKRRKGLGLTQQGIANLRGIKSVNVSDWKLGKGISVPLNRGMEIFYN